MSAWIVSKAHIDFLVAAARQLDVEAFDHGKTIDPEKEPDEFGRILWAENYRSVNYRYDENNQTPEYHYDERFDKFKFETIAGLGFLAKALGCYNYQTCECDDYNESVALNSGRTPSGFRLRRRALDSNGGTKQHEERTMTEYQQKLKETIDEQSLEIMQGDVVIRRLVSALKYIAARSPLQNRETETIIRLAIRGGEAHLGCEVPADELMENYKRIER